MKFLEYTPLDDELKLGERTIKGSLEAYSCKHTGTDKRLSLNLENEILDYLGKSSDTDSSPVEFLLSRSSRKTLIYLVLTLCHMYPDYDFRQFNLLSLLEELRVQFSPFPKSNPSVQLKPTSCSQRKAGILLSRFSVPTCLKRQSFLLRIIDWNGLRLVGAVLLETVYKALDEVVKLSECEIYSHNPDSDADPFLEKGAILSFSFFFYNRKLKRVVSFSFCCLSNLVADGFLADNLCCEEDSEIFDNMDI